MDETVYRELKIEGKKRDLDRLSSVASLLSDSLLITDDSDFCEPPLSGEAYLSYPVSVSLYFEEGTDLEAKRTFLQERLEAANIPFTFFESTSRPSDYADVWKDYYVPQAFDRFTIVPAWQSYEKKPGEEVIYMDPGQVFGAGTHETTRLALALLSDALEGGESLLDVGTGSGILSIVAYKLAGASITACDLDPDAVQNALENMERNGLTDAVTYASDLLSEVPPRPYDVIAANMVAGLLLRLLPTLGGYVKHGTKLILSGIIDASAEEVRTAAVAAGFTLRRAIRETDWNAYYLTYDR